VGWKIWALNPGRGKRFFVLQNTHPVSYAMGAGDSFFRIKVAGT
jgi:hypothetical protein